MTNALSEKIRKLPPMQQQELLDFADYLIRKYVKLDTDVKKARKAGVFKGFLLHMTDDFDAPLDDFKEYMV